jgi:hypothetical protein
MCLSVYKIICLLKLFVVLVPGGHPRCSDAKNCTSYFGVAQKLQSARNTWLLLCAGTPNSSSQANALPCALLVVPLFLSVSMVSAMQVFYGHVTSVTGVEVCHRTQYDV